MSHKVTRELIDFDDGHSPGASEVTTKLALYSGKNNTDFFSIFDNLLPVDVCEEAYNYAITRNRPWGSYITTKDALDTSVNAEALRVQGRIEEYVSLVAVRALLFQRGQSLIGVDSGAIHGTAVWCLVSGESNSVNYHLDYGELYRYETNIIHPPLYAGTCHLSPIHSGDMVGGDFRANAKGIEHYRKYGYKGRLSGTKGLEQDFDSSDWLTVRYRHNRGILHDGDYPHLSTPISYIKPGVKRVILGFNCFTDELSECNLRAPEHSDAFNRTIKLYQAMSSVGVNVTAAPASSKYSDDDGKSSHSDGKSVSSVAVASVTKHLSNKKGGGVNVKDLLKNPALSRLIVLAAKKVKEEEASKQPHQQPK